MADPNISGLEPIGAVVGRPERVRGRRSPQLIALGVLLACLGGLLGAMLFRTSTSSQDVLVMRNSVARGEIIEREDLAVTSIGSISGVSVVPSGQLDAVSGSIASVDLPKGTLVGENSFDGDKFTLGQSQIGLVLASGRIPVSPLSPGTKVLLVEVGDRGADQTEITWQVEATVVTTPKLLADGNRWVLDVALPPEFAARTARLAAAENLVLVRSEP